MQRSLKTTCSALCLLSSLWCGQAGEPVAMPHVDEVASSNSVFNDDPKFAKDPFFPKSTRHAPKVVVPQIGVVVPDTDPFALLLPHVALKGISGLPGRRLALINNRTLQAGEDTDFRIEGQIVKVRCVEVREKSVLIGLPGTTETKEIFMRKGM